MQQSILFWEERQRPAAMPCWQDLKLNLVVQELSLGRDQFELEEIWQTPVSAETCRQRLAVFRDLEEASNLELVRRFFQTVSRLEQQLEQEARLTNEYQRQWYRSSEVIRYDRALLELEESLDNSLLRSEGLQRLRQSLKRHNRERHLLQTVQEGASLLQALRQLRLQIRCVRNVVEVRPDEADADYGTVLAELFAGFQDRETKDYTYKKFQKAWYLNRVEEGITEGAARLYPALFARLAQFAREQAEPLSAELRSFSRELPFYFSYLEYVAPLQQEGLPFCQPVFTQERQITILEAFDLPLARELGGKGVVCNDFLASSEERLFTVTGANQGGKTTFARMIGQTAYLAALGVPVPGRRVELRRVDQVLTHFEREETVETENGKLMDDLERMHGLLEAATEESLVILNETFSSTTISDGLWLADRVLGQLSGKGCLCLYVTFLDSRLQQRRKLVSLRSAVGPEGERTYRIQRASADGRSYALTIAGKHRLQYEQIMERMKK